MYEYPDAVRRWWGPKVGIWIVLVLTSFAIPNPFFIFYSSYVSLPGATLFILLGLILLIDFAHSWSETCLQKWEETDSPWWKWTLISSTLGLYVVTIVLVVLQYVFFAGHGCGVNKAFISTNLALSIIVTGISISPAVQEANPRSGLAQSGMVVAYTTYLVTSAIANHVDDPNNANACNPLQSRANNTQTSMVLLGAFFTFLAIAYSTSRAATQSTALVGNGNRKRLDEGGYSSMGGGSYGEEESSTAISDQPKRADSLRSQALRAAVEAGSVLSSSPSDHLLTLLWTLDLFLRVHWKMTMRTRRIMARTTTRGRELVTTTLGSTSSLSSGPCTSLCYSPTGTSSLLSLVSHSLTRHSQERNHLRPRPLLLLLRPPRLSPRDPRTRISHPHWLVARRDVDEDSLIVGLPRPLRLEFTRSRRPS